MKLTQNEAREYLRGKYVKGRGGFEISKVVDALHKFGCVGMNDTQIESLSVSAHRQSVYVEVEEDFNDEGRIICTFGPLYEKRYETLSELSLSDLLSIEIIPEIDYKAQHEEAVELLKGSLSLLEQTEAHRKATGLTLGNIFLASQIEQIKQFLKGSE